MTTGSAATDRAYCAVFVPTPWSVKDTDETIRAVKSHNAVWSAICEKHK